MENTYKLNLDINAKITNLSEQLNTFQQELNKIQGPQNLDKNLRETIADLTTRLRKVSEATEGNQVKIVDERATAKELQAIEKDFKALFNFINNNDSKFSLKEASKETKTLDDALKNYNKTLTETNDKLKEQEKALAKAQESQADLDTKRANSKKRIESLKLEVEAFSESKNQLKDMVEAERELAKAQGYSKEDIEAVVQQTQAYKDLQDVTEALRVTRGQLTREQSKLQERNTGYADWAESANNAQKAIVELRKELDRLNADALGDIRNLLSDLQAKGEISLDIDPKDIQSMEQLNDLYDSLTKKDATVLVESLKKMRTAAHDGNKSAADLNVTYDATIEKAKQLRQELDGFKSRITTFFGLQNAVNLFQRALREAFQTVKDLDAIMTETAVVTDFSVGDMWDQLPEYTKRANALGVAISDVYEAATLYYQQGLKTAEVTALSNETLKMARIAGLDAADATDRMTNALRGFNMQLTEANAQNVNDVYSKLAAITAADVDEISTAMTKVASLANNANMSFESTAAFLSQIIETTRESAETAGTALKTVIARFSEVKSLYSEGQLTGTDSEGEAINVNKVSEALRVAGINLNEYLTGAKGLDDIFLDLAKKWDKLTTVQQRYIATMAAGSRQQSRFIAMMSDYARTTELVNAANNAAGAGNDQYEKTLDSLQSKLAKLENAWNEFTLGLANSELIKGTVDMVRMLIDALNNLTSVFGQTGGLITKLGLGLGAFGLGKQFLKSELFSGYLKQFSEFGRDGGKIFKKSFVEGWQSGGNIGQKLWGATKGVLSKHQSLVIPKGLEQNIGKGLKDYFKATPDAVAQIAQNSDFKDAIFSQFKDKTNITDTTKLAKIQKEFEDSFGSKPQQAVNKLNTHLKKTGEVITVDEDMVNSFGQSFNQSFMVASTASAALATVLSAVGQAAEKAGNEKAADALNTVSKGLLVLSGVLTVLPGLVKAVGTAIKVTTAEIEAAIPVVGWIALVLTALVTTIVAIVNAMETADERTERLAKTTKELEEAATDAASSYRDLQDALEELKTKQSIIDNYAVGTKEWRDAVRETNQEFNDLIEKYPKLEKYVTLGENGLLTWIDANEVQKVINEYGEKAERTAINAAAASRYEDKNSIQRDINDWWDTHYHKYDSFSYDDVKALSQKIINASTTDEALNLLQNAAKDNGSVSTYTSQDVQELRNYGKLFNQLYDADINGTISRITSELYAKSIGAGASITDQSRYLNLLSNKQLSAAIDKSIAATTPKNKAQLDKSYEEWAQQYINDTYGEDAELVRVRAKGGIKYKNASGETKIVDANEAKALYATYQASKEFATNAKKLSDTLKNDKTGKLGILGSGYARSDAAGLNQVELANLLGTEYYNTSIDDIKESLKRVWGTATEDTRQILQGYYGSVESFVESNAEFISNSITAYDTVKSRLQGSAFEGIQFSGNISANDQLKMIDQLTGLSSASARKATNEIFEQIIAGFDETVQGDIGYILSNLDLASTESIRGLSDQIESLGIASKWSSDELSKFENDLVKTTGSTLNVASDTALELIKSLSSIRSKLALGTQTSYTQEEIESLTGIGSSLSLRDFIYNIATDSWNYVGAKNEIVAAIEQQTKELLDATNITEEIAIGNAAAAVFSSGYTYKQATGIDANNQWIYGDEQETYEAANNYWTKLGFIRKFVKQDESEANFGLFEGDIDEILGGMNNVVTQSQFVNQIYEKISTAYNNLGTNTKAVADNERNSKIIAAQTNSSAYNAKMAKTDTEGIYSSALIAQAIAAGLSQDLIDSLSNSKNYTVLSSAIDAALTGAKNDIEVSAIETIAKNLGGTSASSYSLALNMTRAQTGFTALYSDYENWIDILLEGNKLTAEYQNTITSLQGALQQLFGSSEQASADFIANNAKTIQLVAEGDTNALAKLYDAYKKTMGDDVTLTYRELSTYISSLLDDAQSNRITSEYTQIDNLNEEINAKIRERTELERKYQAQLKVAQVSTKELLTNYKAIINSYEQEISVQQNVSKTNEQLRDNLINTSYNGKAYADWGVDKYVGLNKNGAVTIDFAQVNKDNLSPDIYNALIQYYNEFKKYNDAFNDAKDAINSIQDSIDDAAEKRLSEYTSFEDRVMDAYSKAQENNLNELSTISDTLQEASSKILDALSEQIAEQRQIRENTKAEEDIAQQEARLAYLRRDTSGANALEIAQLEKSLNEARQDYSDSLVDQALERMQKDADVAAEQRATQIELLRQIHEDSVNNGTSWDEIYGSLSGTLTKKGELNMNSTLVKNLQEAEGYDSLSATAQKKWREDLLATIRNITTIVQVTDTIKSNRHLATGGIVNFTGPAWLDGTASRPEIVLNARDSQNFLALRDTMSKLAADSISNFGGTTYVNVDVEANVGSDYDVDQLVNRVKQQITENAAYRNVNTLGFAH